MIRASLAGALALASLPSHSQTPLALARSAEPVVVTASRSLAPAPTLRDTVVITREDLEEAGGLTLGEALQRLAGVELRSTGGPGQPSGIFIRGAGSAQTLVLVDGLRVGSATSGATAIEAIPLDMIERIEVVKGPMSSLYGSEAIGGVVQVFTRGRNLPHLFVSAAYGSDDDRRVAAGVSAVDGASRLELAMGARRIEADSATSEREPFGLHDPDRDPHENVFATLRASRRLWQGETLAFEGFFTKSRTRFDGGSRDDLSDQRVAGARITSSTRFTQGWESRLAIGHASDEQETFGGFPSRFVTRQNQASWINELRTAAGSLVAGAETVRQRVLPRESADGFSSFARDRRDTDSAFVSLNETWRGQRLEASLRHDRDEQFGRRNTGAATYGAPLARGILASATFGRGFRAPTFNDLYLAIPAFGLQPNPDLRPERSESREISLRGEATTAPQWRVTAFDNRLEDLIVFVSPGATNVARARIRGVEAALDARWLGVRWRGSLTLQRPRDEATGLRLQARAQRYGTLEASRAFGPVRAAVTVVAAGERFDSVGEAPGTRLGGYARVDARVRYALGKQWTMEVAALNVADKRYENALGFPAQRRALLASVRFDAF